MQCTAQVLPASAGMILCSIPKIMLTTGAPRIRGDDPVLERGIDIRQKVLPASAGMIPRYASATRQLCGAPRIRGDDPPDRLMTTIAPKCSPHPRG